MYTASIATEEDSLAQISTRDSMSSEIMTSGLQITHIHNQTSSQSLKAVTLLPGEEVFRTNAKQNTSQPCGCVLKE